MVGAAALALLLAGIAPVADGKAGYSLVIGEWGPSTPADEPACFDVQQDEVCMDVIEDVRFRDMLTVSGPRIARETPLRIRFHAQYRRSYRVVLLVQPAAGGQPRRATRLAAARAGESACVERWQLAEVGLDAPADSRRAGDRLCFRV